MDRIWAPWRTVYIGKDHGDACIFCEKLESNEDAKNYTILRGDKTFVIMNLYPYNNGHLLIAPKRHVGDLTELEPDEVLELGQMTQRMVKLLRSAFNPDGFNVGANLGKIAGAGIPGHFHIHVVPRWAGDNNFMPVIGDVRVISEGMDMTYKKIMDALAKENQD
ncbi:HIT family protein [Desulfolucanica intricata]|uniref:HIT family protein n=1 Tax=Desulfolucanica intricata TaxID=1285191 RepID=UPI000834114D|nr:HIT domain-containing protein [Desulfolucanica intricata]